jgi:hypothetical protein
MGTGKVGEWSVDAKARLLAVEVLLADPEQLENDAGSQHCPLVRPSSVKFVS